LLFLLSYLLSLPFLLDLLEQFAFDAPLVAGQISRLWHGWLLLRFDPLSIVAFRVEIAADGCCLELCLCQRLAGLSFDLLLQSLLLLGTTSVCSQVKLYEFRQLGLSLLAL